MSTAALEHLRTGEGRNLCSAQKHKKQKEDKKKREKRTELRNFMLTECLYAKTCTVKDLSQL